MFSLLNIDMPKSVLYTFAELEDGYLQGVIISSYCDRYDYIRIYALELFYLESTENGIMRMRQNWLSCTVESKTKIDALNDYCMSVGEKKRLDEIYEAFKEINGNLNNTVVIKMIEGHFTESTFIYAELYRICKPSALMALVNDIVRYGGEVISVDFLSTSIAEQFGFKFEKCIAQNSKR